MFNWYLGLFVLEFSTTAARHSLLVPRVQLLEQSLKIQSGLYGLLRTMYHYVPLHSNVTSPSPISQNFPLSQPADNKIQARVGLTHSRGSLSAHPTRVFSYF